MSRQLITLWALNDATQELDIAEASIYFARNSYPHDQLLQLELDRRQTAVNERRKRIEQIKRSIASSN